MANASTGETGIPANDSGGERSLVISRLTAGLIQGTALYALYLSADNKAWPATDPYWLAPLVMVFVFVPLLFMQAVGAVRVRTLVVWTAAATVILAGLAWYNIWRQNPTNAVAFGDSDMTFALLCFSVVGLFIAQSLITAADTERQYVASYGAYFDIAWKLEIQLLLAAVFVVVFWGVLWLGAVLFELIDVRFIRTLIEKSWFAIPATTLATAAAIHVTDVRTRLVAGIRTVAHTLLSWLLPLMTVIVAAFTLSLPFTGLAPLWATRSAARLLLIAAATLIVLTNAAFQDGDPAHNRPVVLRYSELVASLVLTPLVAIAAYALWLRVAQYGWTIERIATAATIVIAVCYALGYAAAALLTLRGGVWMALLTRVNIVTAFVVLAVLLCLFSPIADPGRIAVDSQIARLKSGAVSARAFDYNYLNWGGGRFGWAALRELRTTRTGKDSATIRDAARQALAGGYVPRAVVPAADLARNVIVYPNARSLPGSFVAQDWSHTPGEVAPCLTTPNVRCDAFFADLMGDGNEEVLLATGDAFNLYITVYREGVDKRWLAVANLIGYCKGMLAALRAGGMQVVPQEPVWHDLVIKGARLHPNLPQSGSETCPP
jgi:hypothetical protein